MIVAAVATLSVVAGLLLAGILLRVKTSVGTVVLEIHQPEISGAEVFVDGEKKITITTPDDNQPVTITVEEGNRTLKVTKGGFETFTKKFSITSGDRKVIDVHLELAPVLPPQSSSPLPGLIPSPAHLPGIGRWQAVPVAPSGISSVAWSPDGTLLASGCTESTIRLWNTKPTGLQLVIVVLKDGKSVTFSATGELLYGDPAVVEQEIRYLVEKPAGTMEILKLSEFQKRTTGSRKPTARG